MDFASYSGDFASLLMDGVACTAKGVDAWDCGGIGVTEVFAANGQQLDLVLSQVPEPASAVVFGIGAAGLCLIRRRATGANTRA
jgi:hypothetical protein